MTTLAEEWERFGLWATCDAYTPQGWACNHSYDLMRRDIALYGWMDVDLFRSR